jgi:integrase
MAEERIPKRITKRVVDGLKPSASEYTIWDDALTGFGVRVRPSGARSYVVVYRAGAGRKAPVRKVTLGSVGKLTPDTARVLAQKTMGDVAHGKDPARDRADAREGLTVKELVEKFLTLHAEKKLKPKSVERYRYLLEEWVVPELGAEKADALTRAAVARLHARKSDTKVSANRTLLVLSSMYGFAQRQGWVPEHFNPATKISKYKEETKERFLTSDELGRLGDALREAETIGLPWNLDETKPVSKHVPRGARRTVYGTSSVAALRLLIFTGCRLREILDCKWEYLDLERGVLFLPKSKTGKRTVILNGPALAVLKSLPRVSAYMLPGADLEKPLADIKRLWKAALRRARITDLRIHDLRHTFASFGVGGNMALPIVGKLLGQTQAASTNRYAHLANDPLRRASQQIAGQISKAMDGGARRPVKPAATKKRARRV